MTPKIRIANLRKTFTDPEGGAEVEAIREVMFDIEPGRFVILFGPSGCGKSTLLNIIAGFEAPSAGEVLLEGKPITGPGPERGFVFQEFVMYPWRTVLGNVAIGLDVQKKLDKPARDARARELVKLVGLAGFEDRYTHVLSGGMKQRVAIARALATDPEILLMDEPFGALDAQTRRSLQDDLLRIWQQMSKTIVFVTHSVQEAVLLGDRVISLSPRPSTINGVFDIDLKRPRDTTSRDFAEIERKLMALLAGTGGQRATLVHD
ncbi:MAG: ABC transporter ATP-binding protein [Alphaproteobacteria bacterium]|nr:ABC transporter ATP-binding protein [Alphaproteobacteria bacterium]